MWALIVGITSIYFFFWMGINLIGVILFAAGVGLWFEGMYWLSIPLGLIGAVIMLKTDDKAS